MIVELRKASHAKDWSSSTWRVMRWRSFGAFDSAVQVVTVCPNGHQAELSKRHKIAEDGTVEPSYICPTDGCGFHEWVRLVGWESP